MEKLTARAKINLTLNVTGRRENGYHDLELIFQPVSLADELYVEESGDDQIHFTCTIEEFANEKNLAWRAWRIMHDRFPDKVGGLTVHLVKHIPSGAGMAGGSTDASALLLWINDHFKLGLSLQELIDMGVKLGADVPACMMTHATLGRGVGEILTDIKIHRDYPLLLVKPSVSFNTGEMFRELDRRGYENQRPAAETMIRAMEKEDLTAMAAALYNVFEETVPERELIARLKEKIREAGALGSLMTGSGSVVYGIFADEAERNRAYEALKNLEDCAVYCCEAVNRW